MDKSKEAQFILTSLLESWIELSEYLLAHPDKLAESQYEYWQAYFALLTDLDEQQPSPALPDDDKRFTHTDWQNNFLFHFIKRSYFLLVEHVKGLGARLDDQHIAQKFQFFSKQWLDAIAPTNYPCTNPRILDKTLNTQAANIVAGFKRFQEDLQHGKNFLSSSFEKDFLIGENIACTPGNVIYQNDIMQLIQYKKTTAAVYDYPMLIIPPWINKYYILDLQQHNSLVKWLVEQGLCVFMISWVNPNENHKDKEFSDYLTAGPLQALKIIQKKVNAKKINILGYCIGGTLLGVLLAYLADKNKHIVNAATFLTTLLNFKNPGEIGVFMDEKRVCQLEKYVHEKGYLHGKLMGALFNVLRANDLIWSSYVNHYLLGEKQKPLDFLFWNEDAIHLPGKVHHFYLRNMYLNNRLIVPNAISINKTPIDLGKINCPSYFLAAKEDHIVPWQSCYESQQHLKSAVRFVLTESGHVAGVVNSPACQKYGYWINEHLPLRAETFLETATFHSGSWWLDWVNWLKPLSGRLSQKNVLSCKEIAAIESAPGSYVRVRI